MDWIVHIGPQKTGSKAIQRMLADGRRIRAPRVIYPDEGREGVWHEPLFLRLMDGDASLVQSAVARYAGRGWDLGVWSCEAFYTLPPARIQLFREALGPARIVIFVRRQDERANSYLNQLVMAHRVRIDFIRAFEQSLTKYNPLLDYRAMITPWAECFGWGSITALAFDKSRDAAVQFADAVGIEIAVEDHDGRNPNPALDRFAYDTLRELKEGYTGDEVELVSAVGRAHAALADHLVDTRHSRGIEVLDEATRRSIMEMYADSNEWVRATWFPDTRWPDDGPAQRHADLP